MIRIHTKRHGYVHDLQSHLLSNKDLVFIYKNNIIRSINKNTHRVSDYFEIYQGEINLTVKKKYLSINKENDRYMPMWRGVQVGKYVPVKTSSIDYCDILGDDRGHFHHERIIMQQVSNQSLAFRTKAFISGKDYLCGNSTNYLIPKDDDISLPAYLCIINSRVFNYYFNYYSFTNHITVGELIEVPIPKLKQNQQVILEKIYEKIILSKAGDLTPLTTLENEIDKVVFELYGLTLEEREIILNGS